MHPVVISTSAKIGFAPKLIAAIEVAIKVSRKGCRGDRSAGVYTEGCIQRRGQEEEDGPDLPLEI